jgi:hypothetical protein
LSCIILGLASHTNPNPNPKTDSGNSVIYLQQQEARISKKTLKQNEMPFITLKNRCESTAPVITQSMAEMVKIAIMMGYQVNFVFRYVPLSQKDIKLHQAGHYSIVLVSMVQV